ncbi:7234_t:CDS:1 [Cetraspora pellucida]|uniref:7234_t:CDS:1 n=1 Tax=Cetraspora pellucida TaxID=1433469 RepID=A0ACA9NKJ9_9GLOM|nr:7234_t:CDS:1 [Cetraspora pellucida]
MSIAGAIYLGKKYKSCGHEVHYENIQEFEDLNFRIKVQTIPGAKNTARLCFLDLENDNQEISKPDNVECKDITETQSNLMVLFPSTNYYILEHIRNYQIFYNNESIFRTYSEKKFIVHNDRKKEEKMAVIIKENETEESD